MIRDKKRLVKRMPGRGASYGDEFLSFLIHDYQKRIDELEYELEMTKTPEPRVCGGYRIVSEEEYEGLKSDAETNTIKLEACEQTLAAVYKMLEKSQSELRNIDRLQSSDGVYDNDAISRFDEKTPSELADYVQFTLDCGGKTSFAGACLALIKRELDKTIASMNKFPTPDNSPPKSGKYVSNFPILTSGKVISSMKLPNGYYVYDIEFPETCNGASGSCNNGR